MRASRTSSILTDFLDPTGCPPSDAHTLQSHYVDLAEAIANFPPYESKGEQNERIISLPQRGPRSLRPPQRRRRTKDAIVLQFERLSKKVGFRGYAYGIRHTFATMG